MIVVKQTWDGNASGIVLCITACGFYLEACSASISVLLTICVALGDEVGSFVEGVGNSDPNIWGPVVNQ